MTTAIATTTIPALIVEARGEVTTSNVAIVRTKVTEWLTTLIDDPKTDDEFVQVKEDIKTIKTVEKGFQAAKENALKQAEDLNKLFAELDKGTEETRDARLEREKILKVKTEEVKQSLIAEAMNTLVCAEHLAERIYGLRVANAAKGKRTIDSIKKALKVQVASLNKILLESRSIISGKVKTHGEWIAPDADELETKNPESVEIELRRRFDARKAEQEIAKAKAEAEQAKTPADDSQAKPEAEVKPSATIPVGKQADITADDEWKAIAQMIAGAFKPIKQARDEAKHERNQKRLQKFRDICIDGYEEILNID